MPALTRLRIVQLTPCLWSGGTEERIARVLGAMDRREFDVTWMGFGPVREALIERAGPEIRVIPIPRNAAGGVEPALVLRIAMALSRIRPDVMHIHNWSTSLYGAAAARVAGVPRTIFGLGGRETPEPANDRRRRAMRTLAPHFDRFTTVCEFLAKEVERDFAVSPERVRVLRTGVDVARIEAAPPRGEVRRGLGIPDGAVVIGAISVFRPVKRIPDLIDAVGVLAQDRADVHLLLVGNPVGMTVEELRLRAEARGLGGRVHLPGRIEDPAKLLPAFDVFVNCSAFEGSSNAIIEAMAAGIPVVGTAVGGTPELIQDGVNGILVKPKDVPDLTGALHRLASDPVRRRRLGDNGRKRAERRHSHSVMIASYLDLYRELAGEAAEHGGMLEKRWSALRGLGRSVQLALQP